MTTKSRSHTFKVRTILMSKEYLLAKEGFVTPFTSLQIFCKMFQNLNLNESYVFLSIEFLNSTLPS